MNKITPVTTIGPIGPALADVMPSRRIFARQGGFEFARLLLHSLPQLVYPGKQSIARDKPTFYHEPEGLELFCGRRQREQGIIGIYSRYSA